MAYQDLVLGYDEMIFGDTQPQDGNYYSLFQSGNNGLDFEESDEVGSSRFPIQEQSLHHTDVSIPCFPPLNSGSHHLQLDENGLSTCIAPTQVQIQGSDLPLQCPPELERRLGLNPTMTTATAALPVVIDVDEVRIEPRRNKGRSLRPLKTQGKQTRSRKRNDRSRSSTNDESSLKAKHAHLVVERRYRDNLNGKITQLYCTLLAAETTSLPTGPQILNLPADQGQLARARKSDIMTKAIQYVHQSEVEIRHMTNEIRHLKERIEGLEKLVSCEDCPMLGNLMALQLQQQ